MRPPAPPRFLTVAAAALATVCAAPVLPEARAEVLATGSRISIAGGPVKPYMSYGYPNDPEFYAPIALELRRHEVVIETRGDFLWVYHRGQKVAEWDIVRLKLKELVDNEDKSDPLSDDALVDEMAKLGYTLARRTVTKYRKALNIPSSRQRKQF